MSKYPYRPVDWSSPYHYLDKAFMMPARRDADPKCEKCDGNGVLDDGDHYGCVLVLCPCVDRAEAKRQATALAQVGGGRS
jgi:hypothetical protein